MFAGVDHSFILLNEVTPKQSDNGLEGGLDDNSELFAHLDSDENTSKSTSNNLSREQPPLTEQEETKT